jgi:nucleoside-diphosphate-sugar epimerase
MKFSKVLVVGGAGFVGSNLCKKLIDISNEIWIVDNLLSAEASNIPISNNITFINGSISNDNILYKLPKDFDYIFHLATFHGNQSSMADPIADHENNTLTTLKICEYFKDSSTLKKLVYSSAGCVVAAKTYDAPQATDEEKGVSLYLDSPYQMSKIFGEFYGNYYLKQYNLPFVKARFQNVYGPGEILGAGQWRGTQHTIWRNVTPTFVWKAMNNIPLTLDNAGETTRDFIYVEDIADGLIACAENGKAGGVYNLASGKETKIRELAEKIIELTGSKSELKLLPKRDWDNSGRRYGNPEKSEKEIGFKSKINFEEGIKRTVEWTIQNKDMISTCINRHSYYSFNNS